MEGRGFCRRRAELSAGRSKPRSTKGWKRPKRGYLFGRRIDFATATEEALIDLPGVGPSLAKKLMMLRATNPHPTWEDIDAVSGVGPVTLKRLKSQLILGE